MLEYVKSNIWKNYEVCLFLDLNEVFSSVVASNMIQVFLQEMKIRKSH